MDNTENHTPAYFPFIPGMPVMVTKNVFQSLGLANGSAFTSIDVLPDPLSPLLIYPQITFVLLFLIIPWN
jgi:hypothetical protein